MRIALDCRARLGECPRWDEQNQLLYWVDIDAMQLHRFNPVSGNDEYRQFDEAIGSFVLRKDGGFIIATDSGFHYLDDFNAQTRPISDPEAGIKTNRFNDGRCDAAGRFLAGTVYTPKDRGGANLYSLSPDMTLQHLESDIITANGLAFSLDNQWMYFADTPRHVIYRYRYDLASGHISERVVFHQFPHGKGRPDGAAMDSEGCYWSALYEGGRVVRLNPQGEVIQQIFVPAHCPTMVAFGGEDLKTLYITSIGDRPAEELKAYPYSGALFSVELDVAGLTEQRFG